MNISLSEINSRIKSNYKKFIDSVNSDYYNQMKNIALDIAENRENRPIILLAGPSGSGKTTSALMIEKILDDMGISTHTFSMDNYFRPLSDSDKLLLERGELDLESPARVDSGFLRQQLEAIDACEEIQLPRYNFELSAREFSDVPFRREKGDLVILEGIHALNPDAVPVDDNKTAKIYVSVRTRITDGESVLHPSKIRLMRRLARDRKYRKRSFTDTIAMFKNVEAGAEKYIMPYKYRSTYDVDTFMAYEICAYRCAVMEELSLIDNEPIIDDALSFLRETEELSPDLIPPESLICEFVGNGQFTY